MQSAKITVFYPVILILGLLLSGCAVPHKLSTLGIDSPDAEVYYKKPSHRDLHNVQLLLAQLQVGMTRETVLNILKPNRLLLINYHGSDALNTYWLRPGVKVVLHFSNRDPLLKVPDELPHGEPDDVLLDLPDSIFIAAGPDVPEPEKSWQKISISSLD